MSVNEDECASPNSSVHDMNSESDKNSHNCEDLKTILPTSFEHRIKSTYNSSSAIILANVKTEDEAKCWTQEFQNLSKTTFSISHSRKVSGKKVIFKQYLRCIHNSKSKNKKINSDIQANVRNTDCPAQISFTIRNVNKNSQFKREVAPDPEMPCEIYVRWDHNHPINSADALRFRPVCDSVKEKLRDLYRRGHSVATALESIKIDIQTENPDNFEELLADRNHCPDYQSCYRLYCKEFQKNYGDANAKDFSFIQTKLEEYNTQCGMKCAEWRLTDEEVIVVICTPLMRRVHKLTPQSAEIVFMDSSGTVDRDGRRIFLLLTHNECGGVPLGVFITSSEATVTVTKALVMLKEMVGNDGFYAAKNGPAVFMTDDSESERKSLSSVWPDAILLLCLFHILQALWRWLQQGHHSILKDDRKTLYHLFKDVVFAPTEDDCAEKYEALLINTVATKYTNFISHISKRYWQRREDWAIYFRAVPEIPIRGNNKNNYSEAAMRVLKDKVFERVKAFNLVQMVDYVITRLECYYERRLLDSSHNRKMNKMFNKKWLEPSSDILSQIQSIGNNTYSVPSEKGSGTYIIDAELKFCECPVGVNGAMCKHQVWLAKWLDEPLVASRTIILCKRLFTIATGKEPAAEWLIPLHNKPGCSQSPDIRDMETTTSNTGTGTDDDDECHQEMSDEAAVQMEVDQEDYKEMGLLAISRISQAMAKMLAASPEDVSAALQKMSDNINKIKTPSSLVSAAVTFGKVSATVARRGSRIPVQPTAIARRRTLLSGRRNHVGGRPRRCNSAATKPKFQTLPRKRPAPHNLALCVDQNVALGSTHSTK